MIKLQSPLELKAYGGVSKKTGTYLRPKPGSGNDQFDFRRQLLCRLKQHWLRWLFLLPVIFTVSGFEESTMRSELTIKIEEIMERYKDVAGFTDVTEMLCAKLDEENLAKATQEVEGLNVGLNVMDASDPNVPQGASIAEFSRNVHFIKRQVLSIYVKDNPRYCEAFVNNVSGM